MFKFLTGVLTGFIVGGFVCAFGTVAYNDAEANKREKKIKLAEDRGYNKGLKYGFMAGISNKYTVWSNAMAGDPKFVMTPYNKDKHFVLRSDETGYEDI